MCSSWTVRACVEVKASTPVWWLLCSRCLDVERSFRDNDEDAADDADAVRARRTGRYPEEFSNEGCNIPPSPEEAKRLDWVLPGIRSNGCVVANVEE